MKRPSVIDWRSEKLEKEGAINEVDADYYAAFLKMDDKELRRFIRVIIYMSAQEINRMAFGKKKHTDADYYRLVQNLLALMFEGWLCFGDTALVMVKPVGPGPTPEAKQLLEERVAKAMPLIRRAFIEVLNRKRRSSSDSLSGIHTLSPSY